MLPKSSLYSQAGYVGLTVVVFLIMLSMLIFPWIFPPKGQGGGCKAGTAPTAEVIETWPAFDANNSGLPFEEQPTAQFKLIRKDVPVSYFLTAFNTEAYTSSEGTSTHMVKIKYLNENSVLLYPKQNFGEHTIEPVEGSSQRGVHLWGEKLAFVMKMDGPGTPTILVKRPSESGLTVGGIDGETDEPIRVVDVYQEVGKAKDVVEGKAAYAYDELFQCDEGGPLPQSDSSVLVPQQDVSEKKDQLQLEWFQFGSEIGVWGTHCKPAVYLYPEKKQLVNVRVFPKGELTYTDPVYDPEKGWTVTAYPSGNLEIQNSKFKIQNYGYLYYESKIFDSEIKKPEIGWVVRGPSIKGQELREMRELFDQVLPQLGLNEKEKSDFENYWLSKLPESPYYFVGVIDKSQRDYLEALSVNPKPQTSIRFSLYFEALDQPKVVSAPVINTPIRSGFTLVDWGGMIKLHPGTEFTCSQ